MTQNIITPPRERICMVEERERMVHSCDAVRKRLVRYWKQDI